MTSIQIAVISDPHFSFNIDSQVNKHSKLVIPKDADPEKMEMLKQLKLLIQEQKLEADLLLTPGDITTFANTDALKFGWNELKNIGEMLKAKALIASTGNHDIGSRLKKELPNSTESMADRGSLVEELKLLEPDYPIHVYDQSQANEYTQQQIEYFGSALATWENDNVRVVTFNSCSSHTADAYEQSFGKVTTSTLKYLDRLLLNTKNKDKINLLLSHHRPLPQSKVDGKNFDFTLKGDQILEKLQNDGPWLMIHGHKHVGEISIAPSAGAMHAPLIFSASSFGAKTEIEDSSDMVKNHIYFLKIERRSDPDELFGSLQVYEWRDAIQKWEEILGADEKISSSTGFGNKDIQGLAKEIAQKLQGINNGSWQEISDAHIDLAYLMFGDRKKLIEILRIQHSIKIEIDNRTKQYSEWSRI
jgi:predicted MPP superfamily phosphohydrolase